MSRIVVVDAQNAGAAGGILERTRHDMAPFRAGCSTLAHNSSSRNCVPSTGLKTYAEIGLKPSDA